MQSIPGAERASREGAVPLRVAVRMSEVDRALIRLLQEDGRASYARLSRSVGITEKTARRRVDELVRSGVIEITTVTDPELLGYQTMALLGVRVSAPASASAVAAELAELEVVDHVVVTAGRYDLLVEIVCRDDAQLLTTLERSVRALPGITELELLPYLRLHYQEPRWEAARWKAGRSGLAENPPALDELDRRIVAGLNADGRTPFLRLARELGVSESQVRQRAARLLESGAVRVMAITNPRSLGFRTTAWLAIVASPGVQLSTLADALSRLPSIAYLAVCAGRFDLAAEAICVDRADLLRVLDEEVRPLPGVARAEALLYLELHYKRLRPA